MGRNITFHGSHLLTVLAITGAILMLLPAAAYLLGIIKDPFHPLIFVGIVSYFIAPERLIFNQQAALEHLPASMLIPYQIIGIISVLGIYAGWYWGGRVKKRMMDRPPQTFLYDPGKLIIVATIFMVVGNISHYRYKDAAPDAVSGYVRDLSRLWIAASILVVQAILLTDRKNRMPLFVLLALTLYPPVEHFISYGGRGDTFRLAALVMLVYLMVGKRPSRALFIGGSCALALILATLTFTRGMVTEGEAPNRIVALAEVVPQFLKGNLTHADPSDEEIFGAAIVETVRQEDSFGHGLGLTVGFVGRFLPRQLFPNKDDLIFFSNAYDPVALTGNTGLVIPGGAAPSGFANGFFELGWLCPIIWIIFGFVYRRYWLRSVEFPDMRHMAYLAAFMMVALYCITQDLLTGEVNFIYAFLPLWLTFRWARLPAAAPALAPVTS